MMFCKLHLVDSRCLFSAFKPERTRNAAQHMQKADSNNCSKLFLLYPQACLYSINFRRAC